MMVERNGDLPKNEARRKRAARTNGSRESINPPGRRTADEGDINELLSLGQTLRQGVFPIAWLVGECLQVSPRFESATARPAQSHIRKFL